MIRTMWRWLLLYGVVALAIGFFGGRLYERRQVKVPIMPAVVEMPAPQVIPPPAPVVPVCKDWVYTVKKNDTFGAIAEEQTGSVWYYHELAALNGITNPDVILPDNPVKIPCSLFNTPPALRVWKSVVKGGQASALPQFDSLAVTAEVDLEDSSTMAEAEVEAPIDTDTEVSSDESPVELVELTETLGENSSQGETEVSLSVPGPVTVVKTDDSVRVMKPGVYEIRVSSNSISTTPGLFPALVVSNVDENGRCQCEKTTTLVEETSQGDFKLLVLLVRPLLVSDYSSVVFDPGGEVAPVAVPSSVLYQGDLVSSTKKFGRLDKKRYSNLQAMFPGRPGIASRIFRRALSVGVPSVLGFAAGGPAGSVVPVVNEIIRWRLEKAQREMAKLASVEQ